MMRSHTFLRTAAAVTLTAGPLVAPFAASSVSATPVTDVTAPTTVFYGPNGPSTPVTVDFTTADDSSIFTVELAGLIIEADCAAGDTALSTTVIGGAAVIEAALAASTTVSCDMTLGLASPATPPASDQFVVIEQDVFGIELNRGSSAVDLTPIDIVFTAGDTSLVDGDYNPYEPRSIDDRLAYDLGIEASATAPLAVGSADGSSVIGCPDATGSSLDCSIERALTADDLAVGEAPMSATVYAGGFPVAVLDRTVEVFAERRLGLDITVDPLVPRVGDLLSISLSLENQGSVELTDFVLTGGDLGSLSCDGSGVETVVLAPAQSIVCTSSRQLTSVDVHPNTPIVVRSTSPVPGDSDNVDDDATSTDDVDASLPVPFTVGAANVVASVTLDDAVVLFPLGAATDGSSTVRTTATVSLSSGHRMENWARIELPLEPAPGVTLTDCDDVIGGQWCRVEFSRELATWTPNTPMSRPVSVEIDSSVLGGSGLVDVQIGGVVVASPDIRQDITPGSISAAGLDVALSTKSVALDGDTTTARIELTTRPGARLDITVAPARGVIDRCAGPGADIAVVRGPDGFAVTGLAPSTTYSCSMTLPVTQADRNRAEYDIDLGITTRSGTSHRSDDWSASIASNAFVVTAKASPAAPAHGYHPDGDDGRPKTIVQEFAVRLLGSTAGPVGRPVASVGADSDDSVVCTATTATTWTCRVTHAVTPADLDLGLVDVGLDVRLSVGELELSDSASTEIEVRYEEIDVTVTEISSPSSRQGYWVGDSIHFLVQVRNTGTMPVTFDGVDLGGTSTSRRSSLVAPSLTNALIDATTTLAPGESYDAGIEVTVPTSSIVAGAATLSFTIDVGSWSETVVVDVPMTLVEPPAPTPEPQPEPTPTTPPGPLGLGEPGGPVPQLPATGSSGSPILWMGLLFVATGVVARRRSTDRPLRVTYSANRVG